MSIKERIKAILNSSKNKKKMEEKERLIQLYNELEKEGYSFSDNREFLGSFRKNGKSCDKYKSTTTLFKNGFLVIDTHNENEFSDNNCVEQEKGYYSIVAKDGNGEFVVIPSADVEIRETVNVDMRCVDTYATVNGTIARVDGFIHEDLSKFSPEFNLCLSCVKQLQKEIKAQKESNQTSTTL